MGEEGGTGSFFLARTRWRQRGGKKWENIFRGKKVRSDEHKALTDEKGPASRKKGQGEKGASVAQEESYIVRGRATRVEKSLFHSSVERRDVLRRFVEKKERHPSNIEREKPPRTKECRYDRLKGRKEGCSSPN